MTAKIIEFCALAITVSFTAVVVAGATLIVLGIISVILGKDCDN